MVEFKNLNSRFHTFLDPANNAGRGAVVLLDAARVTVKFLFCLRVNSNYTTGADRIFNTAAIYLSIHHGFLQKP